MAKTYVLDTNVLLHNPDALFSFEENHVVLPLAVIEEVDNQKKRQDEVGRNARTVSQRLDRLRQSGRLSEGVRLPRGGTLRIEINHRDGMVFPPGFDPVKGDNRILGLVCHLSREAEGPVILVTKDLNLRIKADVVGIAAEDFHTDQVDYRQLYSGMGEIEAGGDDLARFYREGRLAWPGSCGALPHQFFIVKNPAQPSQSALARYDQEALWPLVHGDAVNWGIKALNKEQRFALELLLNDQIKVVTLVGRAGTGKTVLALSVGLQKVLEQGIYTRLLVTRPIIPMGNDLGYLPGTKEEKLRPWMQPIYDNLELLFSRNQDPFGSLQELEERGTLVLEALTYIRGRSIPKQFILCDEAQNLTPHMIKTLITRVGEGTKIIFTGDPDQIDHPYLDSNSNGLTYLVERFKGEAIAGHVTLVKGERSRVAELGSKLL